MARTLFTMSTSSSSKHYTPYALKSFFAHTSLLPGDEFLLVDNDADFDIDWLKVNFPSVHLYRRPRRASFAENANYCMKEADALGADLFFMNNDIIYTPRWNEPLRVDVPSVITPTCNQNYCYDGPNLKLKPTMTLEEYVGNEAEFLALVAQHLAVPRNFVRAYKTNFFCVKVPRSVYTVAGGFDTRFKIAGGEDDDYSARAHLLGLSVMSADQSYLLHFGGRSTWSGLESKEEWLAREQRFISQFAQKWGPSLAKFLLTRDRSVVDQNPVLGRAEAAGGIAGLINGMMELDGVTPPPLRLPIDPGET